MFITHLVSLTLQANSIMLALKYLQNYKQLVKIVPHIRRFKVHQIHTQSVLLKQKSNFLNVEIKGDIYKFPYVWLRDNCQCKNCFHPTAKSRTIDWTKFNVNVAPKNIITTDTSLKVTWDDGHTSEYGFNWLKFRSFNEDNQRKYCETIYKPKKITWNGENFKEIFSKHDFNEVLNTDKGLYNWLHKLSVYGVALIQNTPNSEHAVEKIASTIGFTRQTHYGVKFIVQHVPNTSNVAYLSNNLQMHTDLPYYDYCPGINLLHCLVQTQSKGGENFLSDCHFIAKFMKENHKESYKILTNTEVEWCDIGTEDGNTFYKLHREPVISLDKHGEIRRINFSVPQRGSHFPVPIDMVKPWYESHALFAELNHKFAAKFKTREGDILCFDNSRLLHGRNGYEDNLDNVRKLIGAYLDWDEIYSRLRCLKVTLDPEEGLC